MEQHKTKNDSGHYIGYDDNDILNDRPIIGILAQEQSYYLEKKYPGQYKSYIGASYVKAAECAGARVVPIWIGKNEYYYNDILNKINGVLLPGGRTYFNSPIGYADAGGHIFKISKNLNENGVYFPLWGTCLGFQLLLYLDAGMVELREDCLSQKVSRSLIFTQDFRNGRIFSAAPEDVIEILSRENVTANFHQYCITTEMLRTYNIENNWKVLSLNKDNSDKEFISTIEHNKYPFYGVQFHPEKVQFEWRLDQGIAHTMNAVRANRFFMDFFVAEARKNRNSFASIKEEQQHLIYNYQPVYTGAQNINYEQCYMFP